MLEEILETEILDEADTVRDLRVAASTQNVKPFFEQGSTCRHHSDKVFFCNNDWKKMFVCNHLYELSASEGCK